MSNALETLTVERGHQEDEDAQGDTAHGKSQPTVAQTLEAGLDAVDEGDEIQGHKAAEHAQQHHKGDARGIERFALGEEELDIVAGEGVGHRSTCHRSGNQRDGGSCREVEHEHLDGEQHTGDGSLEDACDTGCRATSHEHRQQLGLEFEGLTQVAADGSTSEHDGALGTHRTAEADGQRRGDE